MYRISRLLGRSEGPAERAFTAAPSPPDLPSVEPLDVKPDYLDGQEEAALLRDARFWSAFLNLAFMPQASELDSALIAEATGLQDAEVLAWWHELSGNYEGVFQLSDGYVERPRSLRVRFEAGRQLEIQFHPGAIIYEMRGRDGVAESLAELSGNWVLPGLTWSEAELLAGAAQRHSSCSCHSGTHMNRRTSQGSRRRSEPRSSSLVSCRPAPRRGWRLRGGGTPNGVRTSSAE
jgi:hypothetical protein